MPLKKTQNKIMGRGDRKTAKGKRFRHSFGKTRPHKIKKSVTAKPAGAKKTTAKPKTEAKPKTKAKAKKKEE